jgi:aminobenzoyl-glutamate utilization protein B
MDVGVNFLREHVKPTARIHYVIKDGGKAPNVVPDRATVWYFVRDVDRKSVDELYQRVLKIAQGAAMMTETTYDVNLITGVYDLLINKSLAETLKKNLELVGPPQFTEKEQEFAKELQKSMGKEQDGLSTKIETYAEAMADEPVGGGSTDVGDVSWIAPVASLGTACWPKHTPGHSWGVVTCTGSSIGQKGMAVTSKVIAASVVDVLMDPSIAERAQAEFKEKTKGFVYKSAIPKEQKPPLPQ